jgi:thymidylate synthase
MFSYINLLRYVMLNGEKHEDRTGVGTTSVFGFQFRHPMKAGFPLLTTKKLPFRWIKEELFWFLRGDTNEKSLQAVGVDIWQEWATAEQCAKFGRKEGDLGPVYGRLWRNFGAQLGTKHSEKEPHIEEYYRDGVDQIQWLLNEISTKPNSRRLLVTGCAPTLSYSLADKGSRIIERNKSSSLRPVN